MNAPSNLPLRSAVIPAVLLLCLLLPSLVLAGSGSPASVTAVAHAEAGTAQLDALSASFDATMKAYQEVQARVAAAADPAEKARLQAEADQALRSAKDIMAQIMEQADNVEAKVKDVRKTASEPQMKKLDNILAYVQTVRQAAAARLG